jgi:hypothetical protein
MVNNEGLMKKNRVGRRWWKITNWNLLELSFGQQGESQQHPE